MIRVVYAYSTGSDIVVLYRRALYAVPRDEVQHLGAEWYVAERYLTEPYLFCTLGDAVDTR